MKPRRPNTPLLIILGGHIIFIIIRKPSGILKGLPDFQFGTLHFQMVNIFVGFGPIIYATVITKTLLYSQRQLIFLGTILVDTLLKRRPALWHN